MEHPYIVSLYVEGDEHDGETFVCGLYHDRDRAEQDAERLSNLGTASVHPVHISADEVERLVLPSA